MKNNKMRLVIPVIYRKVYFYLEDKIMRKFLIDTDTASDDAIAIIMALREESIKVEAITTVFGNVPIDLCLKNALVSVEIANTYAPSVYKGMDRPIMRDAVYSTPCTWS